MVRPSLDVVLPVVSRRADSRNCPGDIFRLYLGTRPVVFASTNELVNELCDEKRFHKSLGSALRVRTI